ncbi:MAG: Recombinase [Parcubacteria group bacterium GW2011_GWC2_42_12]|uniref:Recombinase n=1 Tax=Candidatus Falkowbacteria bacterium GW2011_GWA2_41_14 TaxID=1618635 RepID=A0A0G0X5F9_9BACT|nr:MAG: Recombinase [Candidatus Falkowbacteria bacterium GW2011_GWA2_41_14]KKS34814.1 MAG: Recombinase [Parcubacteria group bacterium GW2011_GWC2_42_12]
MEILYDDRLNKIITPEFYEKKFAECAAEVKDLDEKISRYTRANINYYILGTQILELVNKVGRLYKNSNPGEKQRLMNFLLSNSTLKDGKMLISYKKPFDLIYQRVSRFDWRDGRDSNPRPLP